jgi:RimJ/RimL family protein N-acetyltransferase
MELESPRLRPRRRCPEDRAAFAAINAEPGVARYLSPITRQSSDAILDRIEDHFERRGWGRWAVESRDSIALIVSGHKSSILFSPPAGHRRRGRGNCSRP